MHERLLFLKEYVSAHARTLSIGATLLLALVFLVWLAATSDNAKPSSGERLATISTIREDDHVYGDPKTARAVLIEYSDFECPACAAYFDILTQLKADTKNDIAIVYRHFSLSAIHPHAALAAQATEAAGLQGKFFEMHDELFKNQREWSRAENPTDYFTQYARALGLNVEQFAHDLTSADIIKRVTEAGALARRLGLKGTPTFFINGEELPPMRTYAEFKAAVLSRTYKE